MNYFLIIILVILIGNYLLELVVDILNMRNVRVELPDEFVGYYDSEKYKRSQEYLKDTTLFGIIADSITTPVIILFIILGGFNFVDNFARSFNFGTIPTGLVFTALLLFAFLLFHLPFSIYSTFVIEEKYGFNKTTPKTFVMDIFKTWLLAIVIGGIVLSAVLLFFEKAGPLAWLYCWIVITLFQIFLLFVAPVIIMPIFNKFIPLKEDELKKAIEAYAGTENFQLKGVFTMDGSKRSTKTNAFFTGFGKFRRIVLYDTLIEKHSNEEIVSILAHEIGHYKMKHIFKTIIISIFTTGLMFFILSLFINNRDLFDAFRMREISIYGSLFFFGFLYTPIDMFLSVFGNKLSRKHEYEADAYAVKTYGKPEVMITALKKLSKENLSNLYPHPVKVFLNYSHPPVLDRVRAILRIKI